MPTDPTPIYLHPRHGEPCHCARTTTTPTGTNPWLSNPRCRDCDGTGRVGGDAEPIGDVRREDDGRWSAWRYERDARLARWIPVGNPYSTAAEAATALRCAVLDGVRVYRKSGKWAAQVRGYGYIHDCNSADEAIEAAIAARAAREET